MWKNTINFILFTLLHCYVVNGNRRICTDAEDAKSFEDNDICYQNAEALVDEAAGSSGSEQGIETAIKDAMCTAVGKQVRKHVFDHFN